MASFWSFRTLINSCNDQVDKMVTSSVRCLRRKTPTFNQEDMDKFLTELPNGMLDEIISRLDSPKDYLHFIAVCKLWRSIGHDLKSISGSNPLFFHPLLKKSFPVLLQPNGKDSDLHYFYSITKRKVKKIHLPEIHNKWIPGSWRGWLATVDMELINPIHLFNPITKVKISLPPLSTSPCFPSPETKINHFQCIEKIIIVSPEEVVKLSNCKIDIIKRSRRSLLICGIGEDSWNKITSPLISHIYDVIEFKGVIYIVAYYGTLYSVQTNPVTNVTRIVTEWVINADRYYLVESSRDLLLISRFHSNIISPRHKKTILLKVYILQEKHGCKIWKEVESLHNQVLFVGRNRTLCLDSNLCPNRQGNLIYFADDCGQFDSIRAFQNISLSHDNGVFHMKDRRIEHFTKRINDIFSLPAVWFSPNPW